MSGGFLEWELKLSCKMPLVKEHTKKWCRTSQTGLILQTNYKRHYPKLAGCQDRGSATPHFQCLPKRGCYRYRVAKKFQTKVLLIDHDMIRSFSRIGGYVFPLPCRELPIHPGVPANSSEKAWQKKESGWYSSHCDLCTLTTTSHVSELPPPIYSPSISFGSHPRLHKFLHSSPTQQYHPSLNVCLEYPLSSSVWLSSRTMIGASSTAARYPTNETSRSLTSPRTI